MRVAGSCAAWSDNVHAVAMHDALLLCMELQRTHGDLCMAVYGAHADVAMHGRMVC